MELVLQRYDQGDHSTAGLLFIDKVFQCHVLEDVERAEMLGDKLLTQSGTYKIGFKEQQTVLTEQYRERFPWFHWHLEVKDVPRLKYVYLHVANREVDKSGCLMVGYGVEHDPVNRGVKHMIESRKAYEQLYKKIRRVLLKGDEVTIQIKD